jgi:hypothetical protein
MTFSLKFEQADETPTEPPSFKTTGALMESRRHDPVRPNRTLQVVRVRDHDA